MGIFFVFTLPLYQGPDEVIHYGTIQYKTEPQDKNWPLYERKIIHNGQDIREFNLSEEVVFGGVLNQFDELKWQEENTQNFSLSATHPNEAIFDQRSHKRFIETYPNNTSGTKSFYYTLTSFVEKYTSLSNFSERFFLARLISLFVYLGVILITYSIARKIFTSPLQITLFALFIGLEPMLIATGTIVNIDIALIFSFTLFFLAGILLLQNPSTYRYHLLLGTSFILGLYSKGPAICLLPTIGILYLWLLKDHFHWSYKKTFLVLLISISLSAAIFFICIPSTYTSSILRLGSDSQFSSISNSLLAYTDKTFSIDDFFHSHTSYWGNFGWLDTRISDTVLIFIWCLEYLGYLGFIFFLFAKKSFSYLPSKKFLCLALGMIISLQFAIRFYDWRTFDITKEILIGTPGRYFLPNIVPHFLIIVTGLGFLFTKNKAQFTTLLKALSLGMLLLCLYSIFNVIIPRYYL
ncbi:MAG: hypothetical protein KIH67_004005 [Candidatus Moranbacteria bacterium]|nr:hypothetical protein [Candidatus Moranbacteria bacterium]